MIVISSKKSAEESKSRARARDEQLIDLEWQMNLLVQDLNNVKEENQVLSSDCHKLLAKINNRDLQVQDETSKLIEANQRTEKMERENQRMQDKLKQTREDFKNMNKLRKQEADMRNQDAKQSESNTQNKLNKQQRDLIETQEQLSQTIFDA